MERLTKKRAVIALTFLIGIGAAWVAIQSLTRPLFAAPAPKPSEIDAPCAILKELSGVVQILDPTRTHLIETVANAGVPCGGWVSVRDGKAVLEHIQGYKFYLGTETFVEIFDYTAGKQKTGENQVVLYKGKMFYEAPKGGQPLRMITANSRSILNWGKGLLIFSPEEEESQMMVFENESRFENRFEESRKIMIKPGEASALSLRMLRVEPSDPSALSVASVRAIFSDLPIGYDLRNTSVVAVSDRARRVFASDLNRRVPAALRKRDPKKYVRHEPKPDDQQVEKKWKKHLVGYEKGGNGMLFPGSGSRSPAQMTRRTGDVEVEDVTKIRLHSDRELAAKKERERLIDELSKIKIRD